MYARPFRLFSAGCGRSAPRATRPTYATGWLLPAGYSLLQVEAARSVPGVLVAGTGPGRYGSPLVSRLLPRRRTVDPYGSVASAYHHATGIQAKGVLFHYGHRPGSALTLVGVWDWLNPRGTSEGHCATGAYLDGCTDTVHGHRPGSVRSYIKGALSAAPQRKKGRQQDQDRRALPSGLLLLPPYPVSTGRSCSVINLFLRSRWTVDQPKLTS